jgi:hypothetical protein
MDQKSNPAIIDLDDRLECYGGFNFEDYVCRFVCALSLTCAVANRNFIDCQACDASFLSDAGPHEGQ